MQKYAMESYNDMQKHATCKYMSHKKNMQDLQKKTNIFLISLISQWFETDFSNCFLTGITAF